MFNNWIYYATLGYHLVIIRFCIRKYDKLEFNWFTQINLNNFNKDNIGITNYKHWIKRETSIT